VATRSRDESGAGRRKTFDRAADARALHSHAEVPVILVG
jgi:hypothetical protein